MNEEIAHRARDDKWFEQHEDQLKGMPGHVLLQIARNESAQPRWRKACVEIMLRNGFKEAYHPDLALILLDVRADQDATKEVEAIVEAAIEGEIKANNE